MRFILRSILDVCDMVVISDSTNPEFFALPMGILVESIYGSHQKTLLSPGGITAHAATQPLAMCMLDSLTVHAKMRWVQAFKFVLL